MRKLLLLLALTFLAQSCFSYKDYNTSPGNMVAGRKYKIQRNNKYEKVVVKSVNDSTVIVSKGSKEKTIALSEITKVKTRKFSTVKTIVLVPATAALIAGIFIISYNGPNVQVGGFTPP